MFNEDIERRVTNRGCTCRGCDTYIYKGDEVIHTYSPRNRGQQIYFCLPCGREIGRLAKPQKRVLKENAQ